MPKQTVLDIDFKKFVIAEFPELFRNSIYGISHQSTETQVCSPSYCRPADHSLDSDIWHNALLYTRGIKKHTGRYDCHRYLCHADRIGYQSKSKTRANLNT